MAVPLPRPASVSLALPDEAATAALARRVAAHAVSGDVIAVSGDLGAGKTVFARAFINALPGGPGGGPEDVPSPTFTLLQTYDRAPAPVWHFDLYRLERAEEVYEIGFEEALGRAISLIEWPERLGPLLPADRLDVRLSFAGAPEAREAELIGYGSWAPRLKVLRDER